MARRSQSKTPRDKRHEVATSLTEISNAPTPFVTPRSESASTSFSVDVLYVDYLELGCVTVGYCGLTTVTGRCLNGWIEWMTQLYSLPQDYDEGNPRMSRLIEVTPYALPNAQGYSSGLDCLISRSNEAYLYQVIGL